MDGIDEGVEDGVNEGLADGIGEGSVDGTELGVSDGALGGWMMKFNQTVITAHGTEI